jgi:hypothetical protein
VNRGIQSSRQTFVSKLLSTKENNMKKSIALAILAFAFTGIAAAGDLTPTTPLKHPPAAGAQTGDVQPIGSIKFKADPVPVLPNPPNGTVGVKNSGHGAAGPSLLLLDCKAMTAPSLTHKVSGSGCVQLSERAKAMYSDPALPGKFVVKVPALAAGASYNHTMSFWPTLVWNSGSYQITGMADAANTVAESNEMNNTATSTLTVP